MNKTIAWFIYTPLDKEGNIWAWVPAMVTVFPFLESVIYIMYYTNPSGGNIPQLQTVSFINGKSTLPGGLKLGRIERQSVFSTSGSTLL